MRRKVEKNRAQASLADHYGPLPEGFGTAPLVRVTQVNADEDLKLAKILFRALEIAMEIEILHHHLVGKGGRVCIGLVPLA